jgi:hypothetical protein
MNDSIPPIAPVEPSVPAYKDRSNGLMIFGILTCVLGCLCGLFILLMLFGQIAAAGAARTSAQVPASFSAILPGLMVYGILAVALIWLGIGSIQAQRWARALLLIFSWSWMFVGVIGLIGMAFIMPKVLANIPAPATGTASPPPLPSGAIAAVMVFMFLFFGIFFIAAPAVWIFFYKGRHVKATCESRHPATCWTDACPLPVLGLCVWLLFSAMIMMLMPLMGLGVMPFFGTFLTGLWGTLLCLGMTCLWGYAAWLIYRLKPQGWWLILAAMIVWMASAWLTFQHHDMLEMYQLMGYPQAQIDQIQKTGVFSGNRLNWLMELSGLPLLAYLLFVKRYFPKEV